MNVKKLLGRRIQEIRKRRRLTQEMVSEYAGIDPKSLSNIETGKYYPSADNLERIIQILDTTPAALFTFEHLEAEDNLLEQINDMLKQHPERIQDVYKITKGLIT